VSKLEFATELEPFLARLAPPSKNGQRQERHSQRQTMYSISTTPVATIYSDNAQKDEESVWLAGPCRPSKKRRLASQKISRCESEYLPVPKGKSLSQKRLIAAGAPLKTQEDSFSRVLNELLSGSTLVSSDALYSLDLA
jgi:hypothetical protein